MKKNLFLSLFLLCFGMATVVLIQSCEKATTSFELPRAIGPVSLQITDANPTATDNPSNPTIQITGENALDVVNLLNKTDFTPQNGLITIGLKKNSTPSTSKPYRFNVVVNAKGYLPNVVPVEIVEDKIQIIFVRLVSLTAPPAGTEITKNSSQTSTANTITGKTATINVPSNTIMKDANGNTLSGAVNTTLVQFATSDKNTQLSFPGGFVQRKLRDEKGVLVDGGVLSPSGYVSIDMEVNGNEVKTFSTPIDVEVALDKNFLNPQTELPIKAGDEFAVLSMDKATSEWKKEGTTKAVSDGKGGFKATFKAPHLSFWIIAIINPTCPLGATINMSGFDPSTTYYCILTYAATNQVYNTNTIPVRTNASGAGSLRLSYMPTGVRLKAFVYLNPIWTVQGVDLPPIAQYSTPFDACTGTANVTCTNCAPTTGSVCFDIKIHCNNNATNLETNIDAPVWFRRYNPSNPNGTWSYLGYVLNGRLCTNALTVGDRYDFITFYGPAWIGYTVKSAAITEVREFCP